MRLFRDVIKGALGLVMLLAAGVPAAAQESKTADERVVALERRLDQQAAEIERLRAIQQQLLDRLNVRGGEGKVLVAGPAVVAAPAAAADREHPLAPPGATNVAQKSAGPKESPGPERLVIGGYGSFRFEANNVGDNQFVPGGAAKAFTFRRFVLTTHSRLGERLQIHSETEFERLLELELEKNVRPESGGLRFAQGLEGNNGAEIGIEQLWMQYDLGRNQGIRAGLILPPLGRFNILHDDDYWDIPRRTLTDRDAPVTPVKTAWRELGVGWVGSLGLPRSGKLQYQLYVTGRSTIDFNLEHIAHTRAGDTTKNELEAELSLASGGVDGTKNAGAVAWRVAYSPTLAGEIAFSGYHAKYTPSFLPANERVNAFGLDWKWRFAHGFEIEGEGIYSGFGNVSRVAAAFAATALHSESELEGGNVENEVEIELSGLARRRYGFWTDFKYHWRPAWLKKTFLGRGFEDPQLIPIVRYERVWLTGNLESLQFADGAVTAISFSRRSQDRVSLGVNYRPIQEVGIQLSYEHNQRRTGNGLIFPRVLRNSTDGVLAGLTFSF